MPNAASVNQRAPTGDLQPPGPLDVSRVNVDAFIQPRPNPNAGSEFVQLGQALSSLNPALGNILGKFSNAQDQQKTQQDEAQGAHDRETIRDAIEAQKNLQDNRGIWSPERIAGYEMIDAQIHSNLYPLALRQKLEDEGLWNDEKASPAAVENAMSEVRNQFLQRGVGNGAVWTKTFDAYRQAFENGTMNQWIERVGHIREDKASRMVADDLTSQLLSHQQLPSVEEVVSGFNGYAEKSFTNLPLYASQINRLKVEAFLSAHSSAVNSGNEALAARIMAAFDQIPTKDDGGNVQYLSKTQYGGEALAKMAQDSYFMNRQLRAEQQEQKDDLRTETLGKLFDTKEQYRGLLPSQIPAVMPDADLRRSMETLGMDPDSEWSRFRQSRLTTDNQVRSETNQSAVDAVSQLRTKLRTAETKAQLTDVMNSIHHMDNDPDFNGAVPREQLNDLISEYTGQMKRYEETGKLGSRAYRATEQEVKDFGKQQAQTALSIIHKNDKVDSHDIVSKARLEPSSDIDTGELSYGFTDLNRQMQDDFIKEADAVAGDKPWDQVDRTTLRKASQTVIDRYKPLFEQRVKEINDAFEEKNQVKLNTDVLNAATNMKTGRKIEVVGPTGAPTSDALRNVLSSRGDLAGISALGSTVAANFLATPETNAISSEAEFVRQMAASVSSHATVPSGFVDTIGANIQSALEPLFDWSGEVQASQRKDAIEIAQRMMRFPYYPTTNSAPAWMLQQGFKPSEKPPMQSFAEVLSKMENDKDLMEAVKQTAQTHLISPYKPELQAAYANARSTLADSLSAIGVPTEVSTGPNLYLKPEWVDWRTVPLFTYPSDITNENVTKAMANLKIDPKLIESVIDAQLALTVQRATRYSLPRERPSVPPK